MKCLLCNKKELSHLYNPLGSNLSVYICDFCGLMQSVGTRKSADKTPNPSSWADYGNLRTGKLGRSQPALNIIQKYLNHSPQNILDIGASRGEFVELASKRWQQANIMAIEPDTSLPQINIGNWARQRIENKSLITDYYNLIYVSHTLEHLDNPLSELARLRDTLKPVCGIMYIEVPDSEACLLKPDIIEEFFLDKHVTHWTRETLSKALEKAGLVILEIGSDGEHLWAICQKGNTTKKKMTRDRNIKDRMIQIANIYSVRLYINSCKLYENIKIITFKKTVVWGAGRILDALCRAGLDLKQFEVIIDTYTPLKELRGVPIIRPHELPNYSPKVILVCSRSDEIKQQAKRLVPEAEVMEWQTLLS